MTLVKEFRRLRRRERDEGRIYRAARWWTIFGAVVTITLFMLAVVGWLTGITEVHNPNGSTKNFFVAFGTVFGVMCFAGTVCSFVWAFGSWRAWEYARDETSDFLADNPGADWM
jgi:magnesium-transporting ATPase (P-type)